MNEFRSRIYGGGLEILPAMLRPLGHVLMTIAKGYFGGGRTGSPSSEIDGIQFSDESAINPSAVLSVARYYLAGVNSSLRGYFGGGYATGNSAEIDGIQFSDESAINPSAVLSVERYGLAGVQAGEPSW